MILQALVPLFWITLATYTIWFLFKAKTYQPLTLDDLAITWKLHKQKTKCNADHIQTLLKNNNKIIGFKCRCGYEFKQKRLITQEILKRQLFPQKTSEDKERSENGSLSQLSACARIARDTLITPKQSTHKQRINEQQNLLNKKACK